MRKFGNPQCRRTFTRTFTLVDVNGRSRKYPFYDIFIQFALGATQYIYNIPERLVQVSALHQIVLLILYIFSWGLNADEDIEAVVMVKPKKRKQ